MAAERVRLSYEQVTSIANQLQTASTTMETLLGEIKVLFEKVGTEEVWSGDAANETRSKFDELSAKFVDFSTSVNDCHKYLLSVVTSYENVDNIIKNN